jgi:hypothetical protein
MAAPCTSNGAARLALVRIFRRVQVPALGSGRGRRARLDHNSDGVGMAARSRGGAWVPRRNKMTHCSVSALLAVPGMM